MAAAPRAIPVDQEEYLALFGEEQVWIEENSEVCQLVVEEGSDLQEPNAHAQVSAAQPSTNSQTASQTDRPAAPAEVQAANRPAASQPASAGAVEKTEQEAAAQSLLDAASLDRVQRRVSALGKQDAWQEIKTGIAGCERCALHKVRTAPIVGEGNQNARLMILGLSYSFEEDRAGRLFLGRRGQLLTDILEKGMGIPRSDVYLTAALKCAPLEYAAEESHLQACATWTAQQIAQVQPEAILCLGVTATNALLEQDFVQDNFRGKWHNYGVIPVMPTWSLEDLLADAARKRETWADIKQVMAKLKL